MGLHALDDGVTDIEAAMKLTSDPEDLSLKLRKLFPRIEERFRGGIMAPSPNDFAAITELLDIKRLYEEQEEKWKQRVAEKDDLIAQLEADIQERDRQLQTRLQQGAEIEGEVQRVRQDAERTRAEMAGEISQLNERIKELNQRLLVATGGVGAASPSPQTGGVFFKR